MKKNKFLLLFALFLPSVLTAQVDTLQLNRTFAKKCWSDTKKLVTTPVRWDSRDWGTFGVVTASTAALMLVDEPVHDAFLSWNEQWGDGGEQFTSNFLEPWGAKYSLAVVGGLMGYGLLAGDLKSQSTALMAGESFVLASLLVRIPKMVLGRARPDSGEDVSPFRFDGPFEGTSMPSGHTTAVFAVASVIANQYADRPVVPILSYGIATAAGISRLYDGRHWLSDVVAGAAMGIAVGNMVSGKQAKHKRLAVLPWATGKRVGVSLAYNL